MYPPVGSGATPRKRSGINLHYSAGWRIVAGKVQEWLSGGLQWRWLRVTFDAAFFVHHL